MTARDKQRALERKLRAAKRLQLVALDDRAKRLADMKVKAVEDQIEAHTKAEGLTRSVWRERL